jgi:DNA-directed RNA polymerase II subunit RPB11
MSNTSDFILMKEDHTLGNLLAEHLKAHPNVYMAGYKSESCTCCIAQT